MSSTFLGREVTVWMAAVRAVIYVAMLFGLDLDDVQFAAILVAVEAILALLTRSQVTPNVAVVEREQAGQVIAGPANDQVTEGAVVRDVDH